MSKNVSKRVFVTVPDAVYEELEDWADKQGRSVSNLTAFLVEASLREAKERGEYSSKKQNSEANDKEK